MNPITIEITILAPVEKVWTYFNDPKHIVKWNFAESTWHCPSSENDVRVGGRFKNRMEAKDKSFSFDFEGVYDEVIPNEKLVYRIMDDRKVEIDFIKVDDSTTKIVETFEPENHNSVEMQKNGWKAILSNFEKYVENN